MSHIKLLLKNYSEYIDHYDVDVVVGLYSIANVKYKNTEINRSERLPKQYNR